MLKQVAQLGVGFGSCHSEFAITPEGPRLIEVNYRTVGDGREFLLNQMLADTLFGAILGVHLGHKVAITPPRQAARVRYLSALQSGRVRRAAVGRKAPCGDGVAEFQPLRSVGDNVRLTHSNKDYLGVLRLFSNDSTALQTTLEQWTDELSAEWEIGA